MPLGDTWISGEGSCERKRIVRKFPRIVGGGRHDRRRRRDNRVVKLCGPAVAVRVSRPSSIADQFGKDVAEAAERLGDAGRHPADGGNEAIRNEGAVLGTGPVRLHAALAERRRHVSDPFDRSVTPGPAEAAVAGGRLSAPRLGTDRLTDPQLDLLAAQPLSTVSLNRLLDDLSGPRPDRDARPDWIADLVDCVAELFEPLRETARVGYDCRPENGRWQLDLFLGPNEQIGGANDGLQQVPSFRFDLRALFQCFDRVDSCQWMAAPAGEAATPDQPSLPTGFSQLAIEGLTSGEPVAITLSSLPPEQIGLGLRIFGDGEVATV